LGLGAQILTINSINQHIPICSQDELEPLYHRTPTEFIARCFSNPSDDLRRIQPDLNFSPIRSLEEQAWSFEDIIAWLELDRRQR